jgi:tellurite resistance-related uncharacterized protein
MTGSDATPRPGGGLGRERIPEGYTFHKRTPSFDRGSLPKGLKKAHTTKAGVWGLIIVERGEVYYTIDESDTSYTLTPGTPGLVAPMERHHVRLEDDDSCFHVEFYSAVTPQKTR